MGIAMSFRAASYAFDAFIATKADEMTEMTEMEYAAACLAAYNRQKRSMFWHTLRISATRLIGRLIGPASPGQIASARTTAAADQPAKAGSSAFPAPPITFRAAA
jgi:hypothetical protein